MSDANSEEQWFQRLASAAGHGEMQASGRLKSRIYSALMQAESAQGPLASLSESEQHGRNLCLWEQLIQITPLPQGVKILNHCRFCHARVLAERFDNIPLPWGGCPYAEFQK